MPCRPQRSQRDICAYQPAPSSSNPSCRVFSRQSRQKCRNLSGCSCKRISLRQARADTDDQAPIAANMRCHRSRRTSRPRRRSCGIEEEPTRSRMLRSVKDGAERAIIAFSFESFRPSARIVPLRRVRPTPRGIWQVPPDQASRTSRRHIAPSGNERSTRLIQYRDPTAAC